MFEAGYPYRQVTINKVNADPNIIREIIFAFTTETGVKYLVRVHEFPHSVYALKFHLTKHKNLPQKYNLVLNERFTAVNPSRVIKTVLDIAAEILARDPLASFTFVGVYKVKEQQLLNKNSFETKETEKTQRFRTYKRIVEYFFGPITFLHSYQEKSNSYLLINKGHPDFQTVSEQVITMFINFYPDLGDLQ